MLWVEIDTSIRRYATWRVEPYDVQTITKNLVNHSNARCKIT